MSPSTRTTILVAAALWHVGWIVFVVLFVRDWRRDRKSDPDLRREMFPWDRVVIIGLLFWWVELALRVRDRLRRTRGDQ